MTSTRTAVAVTARTPRPTARGYRVRDFCQREGISRATCWRWAQKGVVVLSRLGPAVGVRVVYAEDVREEDES